MVKVRGNPTDYGVNAYLALVLAGYAVWRNAMPEGAIELVVNNRTGVDAADVMALVGQYDPDTTWSLE